MQMKIYKYQSININLLKSLQKKMIWYSRIDQLNDPYELFFIDNSGTEIYTNFRKSLCVCCFSKNKDEVLMWSHYGDNHKGICLEWEIDFEKMKGSLFEIDYNNEITTLQKVDRLQSGHLSINIKTNGRFLLSKFKTWAYEEEIRIFKIVEDLSKKGIYGEFPGNLTTIYFGTNTLQDDIDLVKLYSKHFQDINYYRVDLNTETMKNDKVTKV